MVDPKEYFWMKEIAQHKDRYPRLHTIAIREDIQHVDSDNNPWEPFLWTLPSDLDEEFRSSAMNLRIDLRKVKILDPKIHQTPPSMVKFLLEGRVA